MLSPSNKQYKNHIIWEIPRCQILRPHFSFFLDLEDESPYIYQGHESY